MPTYNRCEWISSAIDSIIDQSFTLWELLIIDNQSTDNTSEVVQKYCLADSRVKYFNVPKSSNAGISDYLNFGIKQAQGEYIARLDDDDEWCDKDKLSKQIKFLDENQEYILVGGGAIMVDKNKKELYRWLKRNTDSKIRNNALFANPFTHNTVMFRKKEALEMGGYNQFRFVEDWDLWLRLGTRGKFYNFQEYFSLYTTAGQNLMVKHQRLAAKTIIKFLKIHKNNYPNFYKGYLINLFQLLFSYLPGFIRKRTQNFLFFFKRNYF